MSDDISPFDLKCRPNGMTIAYYPKEHSKKELMYLKIILIVNFLPVSGEM